jgi:hypothetical protein
MFQKPKKSTNPKSLAQISTEIRPRTAAYTGRNFLIADDTAIIPSRGAFGDSKALSS